MQCSAAGCTADAPSFASTAARRRLRVRFMRYANLARQSSARNAPQGSTRTGPMTSGRLRATKDLFAADRHLTSVERRQLTVLFCDLVGSTLMSSRLDPEDLRDIIGAYHRCIADTVERFDGFVARYMGDGALVYFGYPHSYEDNAERAVHAALVLVSNIAQLDVLGERLHVRIGIATGVVVVGELVNAGAAREQTALGETPNLAARLQGFADADSIVIAETTRRLVSAVFECRDLGAVPLSGFATPVRAWQVIKEDRSRRRFSAHDSSQPQYVPAARVETRFLIGRFQELALLRDCWQQARADRGQVVVVVGEAGIGKSHLVRALVSHLADEPHAYLECLCSALFANSPLYPVVALFPTVLGWSEMTVTKPKSKSSPCSARVMACRPRRRCRFSRQCFRFRVGPLPFEVGESERQRQRTLQLLVAIVVSFARKSPGDGSGRLLDRPDFTQLLAMLMDEVPTIPLFVLLTARPDFEPPWPSRPYVKALALTPLTPNETTEMVDHLASGKPLPLEVLSEIVSRTDGVPLFVEELTKMVLESDLVQARDDRYALTGPLPPLAIPTTLQDSLVARLDRLAGAKPLAQLCATLGREFSYPLLQAVSGLEDASLQRSLAQLLDAVSSARHDVGCHLHVQAHLSRKPPISHSSKQAAAISRTDCTG